MIFCSTLLQRAASRMKKRQSGAEDPHLRAACVNGSFSPVASAVQPTLPGGMAYLPCVGEWLSAGQQTKWYRGALHPPWQADAEAFVFGIWPVDPAMYRGRRFFTLCRYACPAAHSSGPFAE